MDRILQLERTHKKKSFSTTRGGSLLKKHIKIRTFSDWNEIIPGFIEADLVAHCGGNVSGSFLNTLVLTDIVTGWTEFMPLLCKSEANVIAGLKIAQEILPFTILGLDTDNVLNLESTIIFKKIIPSGIKIPFLQFKIPKATSNGLPPLMRNIF